MTTPAWDPTAALPTPNTWLLEASAGTGKTYQISGLIVRMVAEYEVPIERVMAITFTNAATGELRDRVRVRLRDALAVFRDSVDPSFDPVFAYLTSNLSRDDAEWACRERRLDIALRAFDTAMISTIHGFSQRMLQEFAFDSRQDSDLEVVSDTRDIVEQLVDDALATMYTRVGPDAMPLFERAGFTRSALMNIAGKMTATIEPEVAPAVAPAGSTLAATIDAQNALAVLFHAEIQQARDLFRRNSDAWSALAGDAGALQIRADWMQGTCDKVSKWLFGDVGVGEVHEAWFTRIDPAKIGTKWRGGDIRQRPWWPLVEAVWQLRDAVIQFWGSFHPAALFAATIRPQVEATLQRRRVLTFDGMVSRLAERVAAEHGSASRIAEKIRQRFDVVFVDEFQDTDEAQWGVIRSAFHGHVRLFLIGDPKQAIYGFRGADIHVYLRAKGEVAAAQQFTMAENWRSDPAVVEAMNAVWRPSSGAFDVDNIDFEHITPKKPARLDTEAPGLVIRWVDARAERGDADDDDDPNTVIGEGEPIGSKCDAQIAQLAAVEIVDWLEGRRSRIRRADGKFTSPQPGDFAVLVDDRYQAADMRRALASAGVPAVSASKDSVFGTVVADWFAAWLDGVAGAGRDRDARNSVVTPMFGWTADQLAWALDVANRGETAREAAAGLGVKLGLEPWAPDWAAWTERLRAASERWQKQGFAKVFDREAFECGVMPRVLALPDGERHATDLRHLFELLHVEDRTSRHGPAALATWLRAQASHTGDELAQRLESDARAVKIETIHVSKGLEYPLVMLPFLTAGIKPPKAGPLLLRGWQPAPGQPAKTVLDLHLSGSPQRELAVEHVTRENRREGLRKSYVALTRARHQVVGWFGPVGKFKSGKATAAGRLLYRDRDQHGHTDKALPEFNKNTWAAGWATARQRLDRLKADAKGTFAWEPVDRFVTEMPRWTPTAETRPALSSAPWPEQRASLIGVWRVTSYTGLSAGSGVRDRDEKATVAPAEPAEPGEASGGVPADLLRLTLPEPALQSFDGQARLSRGGGTAYGTWVHEVFERIDFATGLPKGRPDDRGLLGLVQDRAARAGRGADTEAITEFTELLPSLLATPLGAAGGPLPATFALRDIARRDRLDELAFDLRLGEGTGWLRREHGERGPLDPRPGCVDPRAVYDAVLLATSVRPGLSAWLDHLRERRDRGVSLISSLSGILTGSIDLVFRVADAEGVQRYFVVDYKTNFIKPSAPGHYATAWLDRKMAQTGYYLQSLLYTVALHRHLKHRLAGYGYETHVGGIYYLFLRGMSGAETPRDTVSGHALGVFYDRWPKEVVEALDLALDASKVAPTGVAVDAVNGGAR
jgi:exodeoxyribonuclease V beta subunit